MILTHLSIDWPGEREDIQGEGVGGWPTETHILRYDFTLAGTLRLTLLALIGKILQDANTVESYSIEEKGFIVCMLSKVRVGPA